MTSSRKPRPPVPWEPSHRRTWRTLWRRCTCGLSEPCVDRMTTLQPTTVGTHACECAPPAESLSPHPARGRATPPVVLAPPGLSPGFDAHIGPAQMPPPGLHPARIGTSNSEHALSPSPGLHPARIGTSNSEHALSPSPGLHPTRTGTPRSTHALLPSPSLYLGTPGPRAPSPTRPFPASPSLRLGAELATADVVLTRLMAIVRREVTLEEALVGRAGNLTPAQAERAGQGERRPRGGRAG
jgi:hypothetical protein